jgi:protein phosphatase
MGGHEKGEVASQTVCHSLVRWFEENCKDDYFSDDQLHVALEQAYSELDRFDNASLRKMGTTFTLLFIHGEGVTAAHMGDSRIYHIRPNVGILYQSRDHSLAFDLFQSGEISYDEMKNYAQKNIVTRAMTPGEDNRMRPDIIHITDIQPDDYFYMCTDGMLEQMNNNELLTLLSSDVSDEKKYQHLIAATAYNQDNHSAWLIHFNDVSREDGDEQIINEEPTARCNAINFFQQRQEEDDDVVIVENAEKTRTLLQKMKIAIGHIMNR